MPIYYGYLDINGNVTEVQIDNGVITIIAEDDGLLAPPQRIIISHELYLFLITTRI